MQRGDQCADVPCAPGLAPARIQRRRLIAGLPTEFDDPRQEVVYRLASALVAPRIVPTGLYRRAKDLLGDAGIVDVSVLIGWFTMVSATLNAFDVPSDATGLEQQAGAAPASCTRGGHPWQ